MNKKNLNQREEVKGGQYTFKNLPKYLYKNKTLRFIILGRVILFTKVIIVYFIIEKKIISSLLLIWKGLFSFL